MKRICSLAMAAAISMGAAGGAQAQVSLFDFSVYGGGAISSSWFEVGDKGYGPGLSPIFGVTTSFFATPQFGLRLHGAYMPSGLPFPGENIFDRPDNGGYPLNNYFYDLDFVFHPFRDPTGITNFLGASYFFLGGGGLTTRVIGSGERRFARTVGQGTAGLGFTLLPITRNIGLFTELAAHVYDSPIDDDDVGFVLPPTTPRRLITLNQTPTEVNDRYAVTTRLVAGLKFTFGGSEPAPAPVFVPAPAPEPVRQEMAPVRVCVVEAGELREVDAMVNSATGDTLVNQRRFRDVYPGTTGYAAGQDFYIRNEAITLNRTRYVRFGLTRIVPATALARAGEYQGVPLFRDRASTGTAEVLYVPVRTGCEFQTYQREQAVRGVRG